MPVIILNHKKKASDEKKEKKKPGKIKNLIIKFDTITSKLVPTYFLIMFLTLFIFSYYIINSISTYLNKNEQANATATANMIASLTAERNFISPDQKEVTPGYDMFLAETLRIPKETRVIVLNSQAEVIFDSFNPSGGETTVQSTKSVMSALQGKEGGEIVEDDNGKNLIDVAVPINKNAPLGAINVRYTTDIQEKIISPLTKDIIIVFVVITFIIGLFIFIVANLLTKRIVDFTEKITEMSDGVLDERLKIKGHDEVARLGEAFNAMSDKLVMLEQKRVDFVSSASHELRTPLSSIKLMSDSIAQNPDIDMKYVKEFLSDMNTEVDRLNRIIEKLLYLTKLDNVKAENINLDFEFIDVREVVMDIVKNLSPLAEAKNIEINCSYCESLFIMADNDKLWQGIYNIIDNAIKYTPDGGKVIIGITKQDDNAIIAVKDTGIGISEEECEKIFDRFYRVDKARARETGGTGLGLAIALESIEMIGGTISVSSKLDEGSTFTVSIPLFTEN